AKMTLARSLITRLDQPSSQPGNIHVVYLRNAEAVKLAQTLQGVLAGGSGRQGGIGSGSSGFGADGASGLLGASGASPAGSTTGMQAGAQGQGAGATTPLQQSSTQPITVQAGGATIAADPTTNS